MAVSGLSGFVGSALRARLIDQNVSFTSIGREAFASDLVPLLAGSDVVVHLAGIAHRRAEVEEYEAVNVGLTERMIDAAIAAGVRRFVYISSVAAVVTNTPYGRSKAKAEAVVIARQGAIETVVVRPPLVYGRDAKANFGALLKLCDSPVPLPLGSANNRRSMIGATNLADAILFLSRHPEAAGNCYAVTDGPALSLREILSRTRLALGRPTRLWPMPPALLRLLLKATRRFQMAEQLLGDMIIDDTAVRALGWVPPYPAFDKHDIAPA